MILQIVSQVTVPSNLEGWFAWCQASLARYGCGALLQTFVDADDGSGRFSFSQLEGGVSMVMVSPVSPDVLFCFLWSKKIRGLKKGVTWLEDGVTGSRCWGKIVEENGKKDVPQIFREWNRMGRHTFLKLSENAKKHVAISWEDHTGEIIFRLPERSQEILMVWRLRSEMLPSLALDSCPNVWFIRCFNDVYLEKEQQWILATQISWALVFSINLSVG